MYACTGGGRKQPVVAPSATASVDRDRDAVADQTRDLPDDGEPELRQPLRAVPRGERRDRRREVRAGGPAHVDCPHWLPGDLPHDRAAHLNDVNGGTYDGFGIGQFGDPWAYTQFEGDDDPELLAWARDYVLCDNFFASVGGPSYPNHFFFVAGQSGGALDNPENIETRTMTGRPNVQELGVRRRRRRTSSSSSRTSRATSPSTTPASTSRPFPSSSRRRGVAWAYYSAQPVPGRLLLERAERRSRACSTPTCGGPSTSAGRPAARRHRGRTPARGHVGHAAVRALGPPAGEHVLRAQLAHRRRERGHGERRRGSTPRCSSRGTSGAASTTTSRRPRSTTSASASASRRS